MFVNAVVKDLVQNVVLLTNVCVGLEEECAPSLGDLFGDLEEE